MKLLCRVIARYLLLDLLQMIHIYLWKNVKKRQIPRRVIGDAKSARRALDAIAEGFEAARTL